MDNQELQARLVRAAGANRQVREKLAHLSIRGLLHTEPATTVQVHAHNSVRVPVVLATA